VFPTEAAETSIVDQVRIVLRFSESIPVVLRRAAAVPDVIGGGCYIFLLAEEGHAGALAAHRRRDIPFVPHVTVGAHPQTGECERIANQLNEERRIVRARINSVDASEMGESMVRTVAEIKLGSV
jgi:hypothetical protein